MPSSLPAFLEHLMESEILDRIKVRDCLSHMQAGGKPVTGKEFAVGLVTARHLTPYQARAIYHGKGRALLLSNYIVLDKIGTGGMGRIYRAKHRRMDRIVALKVLHPELGSQKSVVQRFHREVKAAARLLHPNIVMAYDADYARGLHFMVMQCIEGTDLSALVKNHGTLSVERAIDYIYQAACGLHYAHMQNMIHRDIKPGNLMVDEFEMVKILDLGLVLLKDSIRNSSIINLTKTNVVMGTVDFMSPEQAMNSKYVDERGDIYSLGMTLYYLLVGKPAYGGETAVERLIAHQEGAIPSLSKEVAQVDSKLDSIFRLMVAKKPDDRFQSMADVIDALSTYRCASNSKQLNNGSLNEEANLKEFLLSLETPPLFVPRVNNNSDETIDVRSISSDTGLEDESLQFDLSSDQQSILRDKIHGSSNVKPHHQVSNRSSIVMVILAMLIIAGLMYQLGKAHSPVNQSPAPTHIDTSEIRDSDERILQYLNGFDRASNTYRTSSVVRNRF